MERIATQGLKNVEDNPKIERQFLIVKYTKNGGIFTII